MGIDRFNHLEESNALKLLTRCCVSTRWVSAMLENRPFDDEAALLCAADEIWAGLTAADYREAFRGHPKIGDVDSLRAKYANTASLAATEQGGVKDSPPELIERLAAANTAYEARFGYIFIICATGKTAEQMLAALEARMEHATDAELKVAAEEQRKITALRLRSLILESEL